MKTASKVKIKSAHFLYDEELEISDAFHIERVHRVPRKEKGSYVIMIKLGQ